MLGIGLYLVVGLVMGCVGHGWWKPTPNSIGRVIHTTFAWGWYVVVNVVPVVIQQLRTPTAQFVKGLLGH